MENEAATRAALARGIAAILLGFAASLLYLGRHGVGLLAALVAVAVIHFANRSDGSAE